MTAVLDRSGLDALVEGADRPGYRVVGPTLRDNAIVLAELDSADELPAGWGVDTAPGRYRLRRRDDAAVFGHSAGPQSWKQFLHPPRQRAVVADAADVHRRQRAGGAACATHSSACAPVTSPRSPRSTGCWAAARTRTPRSADRRRRLVRGRRRAAPSPAGCASARRWAPAPARARVRPGADRADRRRRAPLRGRRRHADGGPRCWPRGRRTGRAERRSRRMPGPRSARPRTGWGGQMPARDLPPLLARQPESPHWDEVADRCLTCGNCTMVCPTCFCTTTEDVTDLTGDARRAVAALGVLLRARLLLPARRQRPEPRARAGTGSGSPTS